MLWRIGGGASRRLSIPRDTLVQIPGHGTNKINAAYAFGGPALTIKTVDELTGIKINHVIIINFANFPKFIDAIGGVNVKTGRICSEISGGAQNGGFTLNLSPGTHHLSGIQALTLARTRENSCNPASNDLTREGYQQQILNAIKSQLMSRATRSSTCRGRRGTPRSRSAPTWAASRCSACSRPRRWAARRRCRSSSRREGRRSRASATR